MDRLLRITLKVLNEKGVSLLTFDSDFFIAIVHQFWFLAYHADSLHSIEVGTFHSIANDKKCFCESFAQKYKGLVELRPFVEYRNRKIVSYPLKQFSQISYFFLEPVARRDFTQLRFSRHRVARTHYSRTARSQSQSITLLLSDVFITWNIAIGLFSLAIALYTALRSVCGTYYGPRSF